MKAFYALAFALFSFAASAQSLDASMIAAYYLDDLDCFEESTGQSTVPAQIVATEPTIEMLGEVTLEADGVEITGQNDAENVQVGAIEPSDENPAVEYATPSNDNRTVDDTIAFIDDQFGLRDENPTVEYSTPNIDNLTVDDTIAFIDDQFGLREE